MIVNSPQIVRYPPQDQQGSHPIQPLVQQSQSRIIPITSLQNPSGSFIVPAQGNLVQQNPQVIQQPTVLSTSQLMQSNQIMNQLPLHQSIVRTINQGPFQQVKTIPVGEQITIAKKEVKKEETSLLNILRQLIFLLPIILAIFALIITSILIHKQLAQDSSIQKSLNILQFAENNLGYKTFYQIQTIASTEKCNATALWTQISVGQFPSSTSGCVCDDGSIHNKAYCILKPRISQSCKINYGTRTKDYFYWPKTDVTQADLLSVCVKQNTQLYPYSTDKKACPDPDTQQSCGNLFCVLKTESCPLNRADQLNSTAKVASNQQSFEIGGSRFALYQDNDYSTYPPFIGIESYPDFPCWEYNRISKFESGKVYPMLTRQAIGCDPLANTAQIYYQTLNSKQNEVKIFDKNSLTSYISDLPFQSLFILSTDNLNLYLTKQLRHDFTNSICLNIDSESITVLRNKSSALEKWIHGLSIATLVFSCLIIVAGIIFFILRKKLEKKNPVKLIYILAAFIVILAIWGFIVYLCYNTGSNSIDNKLSVVKKQISNNCFKDQQIIDALNVGYQYGSASVNTFGLLWKWLFWVTIGLGVIAAAIVGFKIQKFGTPILQNPWVEFISA